MKRLHWLLMLVLLLLFTGLGWFWGQQSAQSSMSAHQSEHVTTKSINGVVQDGSGKTVKYWYDPMVPNQKFDKPGKSPFMDMMLEPKYANENSANRNSNGEENDVTISSQTTHNLGIRIEKVKMASFGESLSAVGRIEADEHRFYAVQTRIPGFVEKLFVRAVGDPVRKGQKVAEIYAPEILAAQQEYLTLLSLKQVDVDGALKQAARHRLKLLGISESEIEAITQSGQANPRVGVYAPASGVLTELGVREGAQLMSGTSLMQLTDLSQVWFVAQIPERDAARLKPGLDAEVNLQSLSSEPFKGKVSYLYPALDSASRTLQVRVELPNKNSRLRPGMYGNVLFTGQTNEALAVASTSIIATGKRTIVIVKEANGYRPTEVTTGQERNHYTEILSGLSEGEEVVASGQFLIDSEASLSGVLARLAQQDKDMVTDKMPKGVGKVVDVDAKAGKITLYHEPIEALGWPSMTMGFKVNDIKALHTVKAGDAVAFDLKAEPPTSPDMPAQYIIAHLEKIATKQADMNDSMKGTKP